MDDSHKKLLIRNRLKLVRNMEVGEEMLSSLVGDEILTNSMKENIEAERTTMGRAGKLLDLLARRGPRAFECFIRALVDSGHRDLAEILCSSFPNDELLKNIIQEINLRDGAEPPASGSHIAQPTESSRLEGEQGGSNSVNRGEAMDTQEGYSGSQPTDRTRDYPIPESGEANNHSITTAREPQVPSSSLGLGNTGSQTSSSGANTHDELNVKERPTPQALSQSENTTERSRQQQQPEAGTSGEPMDSSDSISVVAERLSKNYEDWITLENFGGSQNLADQIKLCRPGKVSRGQCILITDERLIDNQARDNITCLMTHLGFPTVSHIDVKDPKSSQEILSQELINKLTQLRGELAATSNCDGLLVLMICEAVKDFSAESRRLALFRDCLNMFNSHELPSLGEAPKLFLCQFAVAHNVSGEGIDVVDSRTTTLDRNTAALFLESYKWEEEKRPNLFSWVLVQAFLETGRGTSLKNVLLIIKRFFSLRTTDTRCIHLTEDLSDTLALTAGV